MQSIPTTQSRLKAIKAAQAEDEVCQKLFHYCKYGWPHQHKIPGPVCPYLSVASKLIVHDGLLLKGARIVIPSALRLSILDQLHSGHQGVTKCRARAQQTVWWPGPGSRIPAKMPVIYTVMTLA